MRTAFFCCVLMICMTVGGWTGTEENTAMKQTPSDDRRLILDHIHNIFEAYLAKNREALRRTHAADWTGFLGPSTGIERGIEDYMRGAERSLQNFHGTAYRLIDTEIQLYDDTAVVFYVARYDYKDNDGNEHSLPLRSVDIYRRQNGEWTQAGSHITPIPAGGTWGEAAPAVRPRALSPEERAALLAAREALWRAWFANDERHLRRVLPEELIAVDAGVEEWSDRDKALRGSADFVAAGSRLVRLEFPKTEILAYGNVAILFTMYLFEVETKGKQSITSGRGTEVFVRRDGEWVNPGWHLDSGK